MRKKSFFEILNLYLYDCLGFYLYMYIMLYIGNVHIDSKIVIVGSLIYGIYGYLFNFIIFIFEFIYIKFILKKDPEEVSSGEY